MNCYERIRHRQKLRNLFRQEFKKSGNALVASCFFQTFKTLFCTVFQFSFMFCWKTLKSEDLNVNAKQYCAAKLSQMESSSLAPRYLCLNVAHQGNHTHCQNTTQDARQVQSSVQSYNSVNFLLFTATFYGPHFEGMITELVTCGMYFCIYIYIALTLKNKTSVLYELSLYVLVTN